MLVVVALFVGVVSVELFSVLVALPDVASDLGATTVDLHWVISLFMIVLAVCFIGGGRLAARDGRRQLLPAGIALFGLGALGAGLASSPAALIGSRTLQAAGAGVALPLCVDVVRRTFASEEVGRALRIVSGVALAGTVLAPFVGGLLTETVSWRWVFWIDVPVCALAGWLARRDVGDAWDLRASRRGDLLRSVSFISALVGVGLVAVAVDRGGEWGWRSGRTVLVAGVGLVSLVAFALVERRAPDPLLAPGLVRSRAFDVLVAAGAIGNAGFVSVMFLVTISLQDVRGLSPLLAGVVLLAAATGDAVASVLSDRLVRFPPGRVMAAALAVGGVGVAGVAVLPGWVLDGVALAVSGFGFGVVWAFAGVASGVVVPREQPGEAFGVVVAVLVGVGGAALVATAAVVAELTDRGRTLAAAIDLTLWGWAVVSVIGALVVGFAGRRAASPAGTPALSARLGHPRL